MIMSVRGKRRTRLKVINFLESAVGARLNRRAASLLAAMLVAAFGAPWTKAAADTRGGSADGPSSRVRTAEALKAELRDTRSMRPRGWIVHLDNDLFAFTDDDRDYTAGVSVTLGGNDSAGPRVFTRALEWIDRRVGFGPDSAASHETLRSFETGLVLFTPQDLDAREPLTEDRPYANLGYFSTSRLVHHPGEPVAYQSSLTIGVLGLPFVEELHRRMHVAFGSREPMGYAHEISKGGEPTARYAVTRYRLLGSGVFDGRPYHTRLGLSGSIGYLTEASAGLEFRWGNLHTPWWSSTPLVADYAGHPPIRLAADDAAESDGLRFQLSAGVNLRVRAYNAFLQGQFRSSDVTYSSTDLDHLLVEAWLGLTTVLRNDLSISYTVRHQTEELRVGNGARPFTWAGIAISQQF